MADDPPDGLPVSFPVGNAIGLGLAALGAALALAYAVSSGSGAVPPPATFDNGKGPSMLEIPGRAVRIGTAEGGNDEKPPHEVTIATFFIDTTEVTAGQYQVCVAAGVCRKPDGQLVRAPKEGKPEALPVVAVKWRDASTFCSWADKRLPSEEEWEYAARGPDALTFPWGHEPPTNQLCWSGREDQTFQSGPCAVGSFPAGRSVFGIHDLAGNASEWTASSYCKYTPFGREACEPAAGSDPPATDPSAASSKRVVRGGGWGSLGAGQVTGSNRAALDPDGRFPGVGFRCARSADEQNKLE